MAIETTCGGCGKLLSVGDENGGRRARCPSCGQIYTVPVPNQTSAPDAGPPAPPQSQSPRFPPASESSAQTNAGSETPSPLALPNTNMNQFWMRSTEGVEYGPVDRATLDRWFAEGRVGPGYMIRQSELGMWQAAEISKPGGSPNPYAAHGSSNPYAAVAMTSAASGYVPLYAKSDQSALVLAFGILSWLLCPIFGIVAWVMGRSGLRDIAMGLSDPANKGVMLFGYYLGMVHVILVSVCIGGYIVFFAVAIGLGGMN